MRKCFLAKYEKRQMRQLEKAIQDVHDLQNGQVGQQKEEKGQQTGQMADLHTKFKEQNVLSQALVQVYAECARRDLKAIQCIWHV